MDFEVSGYLSKGRQTATEHIAEIVSTLRLKVLPSQSEQVQKYEQELKNSHRSWGHTL